jgi:signal transduction histidine kinase
MRSRLTDRLRATSLRTRLTIWNAAVVLLMTAATLVAVRLAARSVLYADADAELRAAAREVALAVRDLDPDEAAVVAEMRRKAESHEERGWFVHLLTEEGGSVWRSDHCPETVATFPPAKLDREENVVQLGQYRYVRLRIPRSGQAAYHVRLGTYTTGLDESLNGLLRLLLMVGGVLSLLTPLVAYGLAVRATRPVADILATAERLSPTRLGDRLPTRGTEDELDRLSSTINGLLDKVAEHVERQEHFVADAAHELRGPLAALQSSLEVSAARQGIAPEQEERLADMLEAARHLSKVANDLLILAETGSTDGPAATTPVDVAMIARQAVAMFSGAAEDRDITLSLEAGNPVMAVGDAVDLRRLVSNLLDNAIRFTPAGGRVTVAVTEAPPPAIRRVVLSVADTGKGIDRRDLDHVFDRFYKVDPSRSHGTARRSGGLGLAICRSIAESCGGTIAISSEPGRGTTVTVRLQSEPQPSRSAQTARPTPAPLSAPPLLRAGWAGNADG